VIVLHGAAFFGPVCSRTPTGADAVALFDAVRLAARTPYFTELKRAAAMPSASTDRAANPIRVLMTAQTANAIGDGGFNVIVALFFTRVAGMPATGTGSALSAAWTAALSDLGVARVSYGPPAGSVIAGG
jgi:hypothetical protein